MRNSFKRELNNKDPKEIDSKHFLDTGLNIIRKRLKKDEVKDIKVIKSVEEEFY